MRGWLLDRGRAGAGAQGSILAEGILWFPATTLEAIADEIGASRMTVRRDIKELEGRGIIVNKRRFRGVQLGLVVGEVSVQNEHLQPDSKCSKRTLTQPLISSSSSSLSSLVSTKTKEGSKIGGVGEREKGTKRQKVAWEDLVVLANSPDGWKDLEGVDRFGFSKACEERMFGHYPGRGEEQVGYVRLMRIRKELGSRRGATRTEWPSVALIRALSGWNGKDHDGRWIQDTAGYLRNKAHFIAIEDLRKEWASWQDAEAQHKAETMSPEARAIQELTVGLVGKMKL